MPDISIICPCYNLGFFVGKTIASVRSQTYKNWELVVVDDGSNDNSSIEVMVSSAGDQRIRLIRQANGGVAKARNAGVRDCSPNSRYLLFLDADDVLEPGMLVALLDWLDGHPEASMAFCDFRLIDAADTPLTVIDRHGPDDRYVAAGLGVRRLPRSVPQTPFEAIFGLAIIIPSITLIRRSAFEAVGGWDEQFGHVFEDTDLFLRLALRGEAHFVPEVLVDHRRHGTNSTDNIHKVNSQCRKLYAKWLTRDDLTPNQRRLVCKSWQFVNGHLAAYYGRNAGWCAFRRGEIFSAARFLAGALRRYSLSLIGWMPPPPPY